jgi:AraC-like DNA-binding protein
MIEDKQDIINIRFFIDRKDDLPTLNSIGHERRVVQGDYDLDCSIRKDKQCLFQYTVSGEGEVIIDKESHRLKAGQAFLIEVPGPYRYKLAQNSSHWEYRFVSLTFNTLPVWKQLVQTSGRIIEISPSNQLLQYMEVIYHMAFRDEIEDIYLNSSYAYRFLMELRRFVEQKTKPSTTPDPVKRCIEYINDNIEKPIGLEEMANTSNVSKFHLIRLFQGTVGETPMQYLIRSRIKYAGKLLIETNLSIQEIAVKCGFTSSNYFTKVYRKWTNHTPSEFRKSIDKQNIGEILLK